MLRLGSIPSPRDRSAYIVSPQISICSIDNQPQPKFASLKGQFQVFKDAMTPNSPVSRTREYFEVSDNNVKSNSDKSSQSRRLSRTTQRQTSGYILNTVSITRELAFGAFDDENMAAVRKTQSAYRRRCAGRIVFTFVVFAIAAAVFLLRLKMWQQEQRLRETWKDAIGRTTVQTNG